MLGTTKRRVIHAGQYTVRDKAYTSINTRNRCIVDNNEPRDENRQ